MRYINVIRGLGVDIENCVQSIQVELFNRGIGFPKGSITGSWNTDTYNQLDFLYKGDRSAWRNLGSDCAVLDDLRNPNGGSTRNITVFPPQDTRAGSGPVASTPGSSTTPGTSAPGTAPGTPAPAPSAPITLFGIPLEYIGIGAVALILASTLKNKNA